MTQPTAEALGAAPTATRSRRMRGPVAALLGVGAAWVAVAVVRPGDAGPTPCPWRSITGLDCPFCGSTRAAASLAGGDVVGALDHNALFVLGILPMAVVVWVLWARSAWAGDRAPTVSNRMAVGLLGVMALWWVVRLAVPWLGSSAA